VFEWILGEALGVAPPAENAEGALDLAAGDDALGGAWSSVRGLLRKLCKNDFMFNENATRVNVWQVASAYFCRFAATQRASQALAGSLDWLLAPDLLQG
jgi:hypothetical protein